MLRTVLTSLLTDLTSEISKVLQHAPVLTAFPLVNPDVVEVRAMQSKLSEVSPQRIYFAGPLFALFK